MEMRLTPKYSSFTTGITPKQAHITPGGVTSVDGTSYNATICVDALVPITKELLARSSLDSNTTTGLEWIAKILSKKEEGNTIHNPSLDGLLQAFQGKRMQDDSRFPVELPRSCYEAVPKLGLPGLINIMFHQS
jgi:hypothetical protein